MFECHYFLYDRENWDSQIKSEIRFLPSGARARHYDVRVAEAIEQINALEARGYQFEPPTEESWIGVRQRFNKMYLNEWSG